MNIDNEKPTVVAVVGGIGSGKSFVSKALASKGFPLFDADLEARRVYDDPSVMDQIRKQWPNVADSAGNLNRVELAKIVFENSREGENELRRLNDILKIPLLRLFETWLNRNSSKIVVLDAPLLFESGWDRFADFIVFVDASKETRQKRTMARNWAKDELQRREARQLPLDFKRKKADFIVSSNDCDDIVPQLNPVLEAVQTHSKSHKRA